MSATDPRLGTLNPDGSVESWPETDVVGRPYDRPATTQGIDERFFIVLPLGGNFAAAVDEVTALVATPVASKKGSKTDAAAE